MTKQQIQRAARLYALAVIAHGQGGDNEEEAAVIAASAAEARRKLECLGWSPSELTSLKACIRAVKGA